MFAKLLQRKPLVIELDRKGLDVEAGQMVTLAFPEQVYLNRGLLYASQGRTEEAIEDLRRAVELNPKFYRGHFELASALDRLGNVQEAAREYEVATPGYRNVGELHYRLGFAYFRLGQHLEARESLNRAIAVAPGSPSAAQADELLRLIAESAGR